MREREGGKQQKETGGKTQRRKKKKEGKKILPTKDDERRNGGGVCSTAGTLASLPLIFCTIKTHCIMKNTHHLKLFIIYYLNKRNLCLLIYCLLSRVS